MKYCFGFYRVTASFDDLVTKAVMGAVHQLGYGFFPAELVVGPDERKLLQSPADYDRALLPGEYYIDSETVTFPLSSSNGAQLIFTESSEPNLVPASLLVEFSHEVCANNAWDLVHLLCLARAVIGAFEPDYAYLLDEAHAVRPEYLSRMFQFDRLKVPNGVYWVNYYGPAWVTNMGRTRLERLRGAVPAFEWLGDQGLLLAIQDAPYDETNAAHRANQQKIEELLGLRQIQAAHPNPGL